jgi:hypothetical protein
MKDTNTDFLSTKNENPYCRVAEVSSSFFIHRMSGEILKLVKLYGCVAKCELEHEIIVTQKPYLATKTAICHVNNLIPIV